jgi:hypothetical protein
MKSKNNWDYWMPPNFSKKNREDINFFVFKSTLNHASSSPPPFKKESRGTKNIYFLS